MLAGRERSVGARGSQADAVLRSWVMGASLVLPKSGLAVVGCSGGFVQVLQFVLLSARMRAQGCLARGTRAQFRSCARA
jgi:hypothetical protein